MIFEAFVQFLNFDFCFWTIFKSFDWDCGIQILAFQQKCQFVKKFPARSTKGFSLSKRFYHFSCKTLKNILSSGTELALNSKMTPSKRSHFEVLVNKLLFLVLEEFFVFETNSGDNFEITRAKVCKSRRFFLFCGLMSGFPKTIWQILKNRISRIWWKRQKTIFHRETFWINFRNRDFCLFFGWIFEISTQN